MTQPPRTLESDEGPDDVEPFLTHLGDALRGHAATQGLAGPIDKARDELDVRRVTLRGFSRALSALLAQRADIDDDLNRILDIVRTALEPRIKDTKDHPPEPWAVSSFDECFGNENPTVVRKHTLGPQVEVQRFWEKKLSGTPLPELVAAGVSYTPIITRADALADAIATAETNLDHFLAGPWTSFIESANAAVKLTYGQLTELEHAPPGGVPLPPGFLDRFYLRESAPRPLRLSELVKQIPKQRERLARLEAQYDELLKKQQDAQRTRALRELEDAQGDFDGLKKQTDGAAARLAKAQAALAQLDTPPATPPGK
jgi:hypothetical protein